MYSAIKRRMPTSVFRGNRDIADRRREIEAMSRYVTVLWAISLALSSAALGATCPFEKSVYEDVDGNGFRLEFGPPKVDVVNVVYSATITHPQRGTVFDFDFRYTVGHAVALLSRRDADDGSATRRIHFFDKHLRSISLDDVAAPYAFVEGLGSADWYRGGAEIARRIPIGTPLWKFTSCRESSAVPRQTGSTEKLSSAEWVTKDGRIAAYGDIKGIGEKEGRRFLRIDYGEWISEKECRRRVAAGTLNMDESDCEVDSLRYVNQNPKVREFTVADDVEVVIPHPSRSTKTMTWDRFTEMRGGRSEDTRELWDGLWQIYRRDKTVERIEWAYTP